MAVAAPSGEAGGSHYQGPDAVAAWNLMGGTLDWSALPVVVEMYGITDVERFVRELATIRQHQNREH